MRNRAGKFYSIIAVIGIIGIVVMVGTSLFLLVRWYIPKNDSWRAETSPLSNETVLYLCRVFSEEMEDPERLCALTREVYAPDFFPVISNAFPLYSSKMDEVDSKLGQYKIDGEAWVVSDSGSEYRRVWYDLKGDGVTKIVIRYSKDNKVEKLSFVLGDDF